jgi:hypothetical protein
MASRAQYENPLFAEEQKFAPGWVFLALVVTLPVLVLQGVATYQQFVMRRPWGNNPASDRGLLLADALVVLVCGGVAWLVASIRLTVRVSRELLDVHFFPVRHKRIPVGDIAGAFVRSFSPLGEYGGWGLRLSLRGNGWGYFLRGDRGVQLVLRSGSKMLVGSQRPDQLLAAVHQAQPAIAPQPIFTGANDR